MKSQKQENILRASESRTVDTASPTMKLSGGCFGASKGQNELSQPRRTRKDRLPQTGSQKHSPGTSSSVGEQDYICQRRGAVRRSSREHSSSRTSHTYVAADPSRPSQNEIWGSLSDVRLDKTTQERWRKNAQGWNDQQRELDTEQLRRPPSRKPVAPDRRNAETCSLNQIASQAQQSAVGGGQGGPRAALIGLGIERAVSPLAADDDLTIATFPPSPVTPDESPDKH